MKLLIALTMMMFAVCSFSADKYWTGATDAKASKPGNWCDDAELTTVSTSAPVSGDNVYLTTGANAMTWDINDVVLASWTQDGYTGTVTFSTGKKNGSGSTIYGYTEDGGETRYLKVSGNVVLETGVWQTSDQPDLSKKTSTAAYKDGLGVFRIIVDAGGDFAIGAAASINLTGKGFRTKQGPGVGVYNKSCGTHGGMGATYGAANINKTCYGVVSSPITIGSGSGNNSGGGAAQIKAAGDVVIDGSIIVVGKQSDHHVGAGGSIYIVAKTLTGTGTLNANGGRGTAHSHDGGGGGGRIAVKLTGENASIDNFSGVIQAKAGEYSGSNSAQDGTGGTIYIEDSSDESNCGTLVIDGCNNGFNSNITGREATTLINENILNGVTPKKIVLRPEARLGLAFAGDYTPPLIVVEKDAEYPVESYVHVYGGCNLVLDRPLDFVLYLGSADSMVTPSEDINGELVLNSGVKLYVDAQSTVNGSLRIKSGGTLTHFKNQPSTKMMNLTIAGNLVVEEGVL